MIIYMVVKIYNNSHILFGISEALERDKVWLKKKSAMERLYGIL